MRRRLKIVLPAVVSMLLVASSAFAFGDFGDWGDAEDIETHGAGADDDLNTRATEGCPFISPDGKMLFFASNRGGLSGLDIWVTTRRSENDPWGEPVKLGAPINSPADDFCPTISRDGKTFFFVSTRDGHCGSTLNADIYTARFDSRLEVDSVTHLGCEVNSPWDEHSPFPATLPGEGPVLFYSSARPANGNDAPGDHDIYVSPMRGGTYRAGHALSGVNTTDNEGQPNVRRDGRELFFWSDREEGADIYSAARLSVTGEWGSPENLGPKVNSDDSETRPSLSWDGTTLYFGSTRSGQSDIYVTTR